jgi:hypothetical protein
MYFCVHDSAEKGAEFILGRKSRAEQDGQVLSVYEIPGLNKTPDSLGGLGMLVI